MAKRPGKMRLAQAFRVDDGDKFRLKNVDPGDTLGIKEEEIEGLLAKDVERMSELQDRMYAHDRWALLLIFQALDAAGKDGTIKQVMAGINPQSCTVFSFKSPSDEELDHDFLWRCFKCLPERGRIGIFNRSYYEETLIVRVHPEFLDRQKLPRELVTKRIWDERFEDIRNFERYLSRNGVVIRKFFLHVSKGEQKKRFLSRIDDPRKNWKFSPADVAERAHYKDYMHAFEETVRATSRRWAPWYVVPADNKWFTRLAVADAIVDTLEKLDIDYPRLDRGKLLELARVKRALLAEGGKKSRKTGPKAERSQGRKRK